MSRWHYRYTSAQTAVSILLRKKLGWSAPELFNDPFEFKNPFQLNFDWPALETVFVDQALKLITQETEPKLVEDGPTVKEVRELRNVTATKTDCATSLSKLCLYKKCGLEL